MLGLGLEIAQNKLTRTNLILMALLKFSRAGYSRIFSEAAPSMVDQARSQDFL